jgi:hypothetical protein
MEKALNQLLQLILLRMTESKEEYIKAAISYTLSNDAIHKCHFLLFKTNYEILNKMKNDLYGEKVINYFTFIKKDVSAFFYETPEFKQYLSSVIVDYSLSNMNKEMVL